MRNGPAPGMARAVRALGFSEECLELIMHGNAERLLGAEK